MSALALLDRRGSSAKYGISLIGSAVYKGFRLIDRDQFSSSTQLRDPVHTPERPATAPEIKLSNPSPVPEQPSTPGKQQISGALPISALSPNAAPVRPRRLTPYLIKRKAAAAERIKQRASLKADKYEIDLKARKTAAKARQKTREIAAKVKAALIAKSAAARAKQRIAASIRAAITAKVKRALKIRAQVSKARQWPHCSKNDCHRQLIE